MPELPEVEQFRQILLPLASLNNPISLQLVKDNPPRKWLNVDEVRALSNRFICSSVLRKGKLLCMVLQKLGSARKAPVECCKYLYLHMGMTGRLSAPNRRCRLENVQDDGSAFPPSHTYLLLESSDYKVAFSDPRKFGSAHLSDDLSSFDALAPDALHALQERDNSSLWSESILPKLIHQSTGIKALLLDQKRALSGVGNWVADEVMYQIAMHPDQSHLTEVQARELCDRLFDILSTAVERLKHDQEFPEEWLFGYRWTNKKAGIDAQGRPLKFITSGGRTSAIVESLQKLKVQQKKTAVKLSKATQRDAANEGSTDEEPKASPEPPRKKSRPPSSRQKESKVLKTQAEPNNPVERRRSPRFQGN